MRGSLSGSKGWRRSRREFTNRIPPNPRNPYSLEAGLLTRTNREQSNRIFLCFRSLSIAADSTVRASRARNGLKQAISWSSPRHSTFPVLPWHYSSFVSSSRHDSPARHGRLRSLRCYLRCSILPILVSRLLHIRLVLLDAWRESSYCDRRPGEIGLQN